MSSSSAWRNATAISAAHPRVVLEQGQVGVQAALARELGNAGQQEGRHLGGAQAVGCCLRHGLKNGRLHLCGWNLVPDRHGHGHQQPARQPQLLLGVPDSHHLARRIAPHIHRQPAAPAVEGRELIGL